MTVRLQGWQAGQRLMLHLWPDFEGEAVLGQRSVFMQTLRLTAAPPAEGSTDRQQP